MTNLGSEELKQIAIESGFCNDSRGFVQTANSYGIVEESVLREFVNLILIRVMGRDSLDGMVEAFSRVIEAQHAKDHPFHNPVNADAMTALRLLRGHLPYMKAIGGKDD